MQLSSWCVPLLASILLQSLSAAPPPGHNCTELRQPLQQGHLHQVLGTWILIEAYGNNDLLDLQLKTIGSEWIKINTTAEAGVMRLVQGIRHKEQKEKYCGFFQNSEVSLVNSSALQIEVDPFTFFSFLHTSCSECLVIHSNSRDHDHELIFLYGRSQSVGASEREMFRRQASCLNFPEPTVASFKYDTGEDLCPM